MTADELLTIVREDYLDDVSDATMVDPEPLYRWSTAYLLRQAVAAQRQACYRQDLRHLYDDTTEDICSIAIVDGQRTYPLDPSILRIQSVLLPESSAGLIRLQHVWREQLDTLRPSWRTDAAGLPRRFFVVGGQLVLDPKPSLALSGASIALEVWREPLQTELDVTDELEWTNNPEKLAHWIVFQALMRRDPDTQDEKMAQMHLAMFERAFGAEVSAQARKELLESPDSLAIIPRSDPYRRLGYDADFERS